MSTDASTNHQGMFMENGSGGYMGDLVFNGGKFGIWVGNQQYVISYPKIYKPTQNDC
jgi:glucan 1,3-beta-glucosidase